MSFKKTKKNMQWKNYIHGLRKREMEIIISNLDKSGYDKGLELGAGDGFQSRILIKHLNELVCTELDENRLIKKDTSGIYYKICDAEKVSNIFLPEYFDLVFSSNLFEHLPNPDLAMKGIHKILKKDGIAIHVIPSSFWAICHIVLHYPAVLLGVFRKILSKEFVLKPIIQSNSSTGNNINLRSTKRKSRLLRALIPQPHGVSPNVITEVYNFRRKKWSVQFEKYNFKVIKILKGPVSSGYGFGLDKVRMFLEKLGLTGEYIYFMVKINGC